MYDTSTIRLLLYVLKVDPTMEIYKTQERYLNGILALYLCLNDDKRLSDSNELIYFGMRALTQRPNIFLLVKKMDVLFQA